MKTAFRSGSDRCSAQSVMRCAPFVSHRQKGTEERPENSVDGKNVAMYISRALFIFSFSLYLPAKKVSDSYIISRAIKIIYLQPPDLFLSLFPLALPSPLSVKDGILVRTTHHFPFPSLLSLSLSTSYPLDKFRSGPLGATNKTVKPFN